jgi:hypothetical protein
MRLRVSDGGDFDVFTESEVSIRQAIDYGIKDHVVRMLAQGEILVDDGSDLAENRPGCFGSHSRVTRSAPSVRAARSC